MNDVHARWRSGLRLAWRATPILLAALAAVAYFRGEAADVSEQAGSVQIAGSETLRPLVAACAEEFMTRHPQADIVVSGGGSGDGIAALLHGIVDIGMTSRGLSSRERDYAVSKGIDVAVVELALDGVTVVVNGANPVKVLDLGRLGQVFTGRIRNWRELGGADEEIVVFARASGSGTAALFAERVLSGGSYAPSVRHLPTNEAIVAEVAARPAAIGYSSLGALKGAGEGIKAVALRADDRSAPVSPTPEAVRSRRYPLTRTLYLSAAAPPSGPVKAFLDFCASASGQALAQRAGYIGIDSSAQ